MVHNGAQLQAQVEDTLRRLADKQHTVIKEPIDGVAGYALDLVRCRPRPKGAAPGSVGAPRHRPPVARAQTGKTPDTGSTPGVAQASVAAAAPRGPCTLTRLLARQTLPYVAL